MQRQLEKHFQKMLKAAVTAKDSSKTVHDNPHPVKNKRSSLVDINNEEEDNDIDKVYMRFL